MLSPRPPQVIDRRARALHFALWGAVGVVPLAALIDAASDRRLSHSPVSGTVTFDGSPPAGAVVKFHPVESHGWAYVAPSAIVQADGSFQLDAFAAQGGAIPGEYAVTIEWAPIIVEGESFSAAGNMIPACYERPSTTPLKLTVAAGINRFNSIAITSQGHDRLGAVIPHASLATNLANLHKESQE